MKEYELHTLPNGIRLIHKEVNHTKIVHCGFILDIGSRDEDPGKEGLAHFWEHMAFKGTQKRKAFHILNRLDSVGGELNAYTTKEKICFYASILNQHFAKAFELLADITFHSTFPEKQIEKERQVILEEMSMYFDSPDDAIQDEFDELLYGEHPMGKNILGTVDSVNSFDQNSFKDFVAERIDTHRLVFSSVGNIPFKKVIKLAERYLKDIPATSRIHQRAPFITYQPSIRTIEREITQAQCAIGSTAYSLKDKNRIPFFLLNNILGGPSMTSRLNLELREKYGFVYSIESSYQPYTDSGAFTIFYGTEPKQVDKAGRAVWRTLKKLREQKLGTLQLHMAKEQAIGQIAMAEENNSGIMIMLGRSILDLEKIEPIDELFDEINSITAEKLQDLANEVFQMDNLSQLTYLPKN